MQEGASPTTVIHYHALLHRVFKVAVRIDVIPSNPTDKVEKPKCIPFQAGFYSKEEVAELFDVVKGDAIEIPVLLAAYYGLRRSEVIGIKWSAIDFNEKTISIRTRLSKSTSYVTDHFGTLLESNHLRRIRFHDLQHTCASLLLSNGISMKQIQIWLGHSTFSTTADIYSHLDFGAQIESAETMENMFL